jgi:hypothetical protein
MRWALIGLQCWQAEIEDGTRIEANQITHFVLAHHPLPQYVWLRVYTIGLKFRSAPDISTRKQGAFRQMQLAYH